MEGIINVDHYHIVRFYYPHYQLSFFELGVKMAYFIVIYS